jgi:hypothetical protein
MAYAEGHRPRSALGVRIRKAIMEEEEDGQSLPVEENDVQYLSPSKLKAITGVDDLEKVTSLEMKVNTSHNSLGDFAIPN